MAIFPYDEHWLQAVDRRGKVGVEHAVSVALVSHNRCIRGAFVVVTDLSTDYQKEGDRPDLLSPGLSKLCCFDFDSGIPVLLGEVLRDEIGRKIKESGYGSQSSGFGTGLTALRVCQPKGLCVLDLCSALMAARN